MTKHNYILLTLLIVGALLATGCEGSELARQTALTLREAVIDDEKEVDKFIAGQNEFYKKQQETIETSRKENNEFKVDAFRRKRSAEVATTMSMDPDSEVRLSTVMKYLNETQDQELDLWQALYGGDQLAREELKSKIAKLERQKKSLQEVKNNLTQLALAPSSKKRALALLKFSQETYAAIKKTAK